MLVLSASGLLRYFTPFSLSVTAIHMLSAALFLLVTGIHIFQHQKSMLKHFKKIFSTPSKLILFVAFVGLTLAFVFIEFGPRQWIMDNSYESRHREDIFRPHFNVVSKSIKSHTQIHRKADGVNLLIDCELNNWEDSVIAIWAESEGNMIEPLYLSSELAYSANIEHQNNKVARMDLLPVFFDGYQRMKERLKDDGEVVDGVSAATITGSFNLDSLFESKLKRFTVMVEVNRLGDDNEHFSSKKEARITQMPFGVGVPSLLYQADIDLYVDTKYYLLESSGISEYLDEMVSISYDTDGAGEAMNIVEKVFVKVMFQKEILDR